MSSALILSSILFKNADPVYSANLLDIGEKMLTFAETYQGLFRDYADPEIEKYITLSNFEPSLIEANLSMFKATSDTNFLNRAI